MDCFRYNAIRWFVQQDAGHGAMLGGRMYCSPGQETHACVDILLTSIVGLLLSHTMHVHLVTGAGHCCYVMHDVMRCFQGDVVPHGPKPFSN